MLFENAKTHTKQGNIGEARAIYELTLLGYGILKPLCDSLKYDLVVDSGEKLLRVQVKTSRYKTPTGAYEISLATSGGNRSFNTKKYRDKDDYDLLFVMVEEGDCWLIPADELGKCTVSVGHPNGCKYDKYRL